MSYDRKTEPTQITMGERVVWTRTFDGYPATLYTCEYRFRGLLGTGIGLDVAATADGHAFDVLISPTQSATLSVTKYGWQAWLTEIADATNKFRADSGTCDVLRGFIHGTTAASDDRTPAKVMLDAIDAALLAFNTSDVIEYELRTPAGSRRVKRSEKISLTTDRKYWATVVSNEIARERARNGKPLMTSIQMRVYDK